LIGLPPADFSAAVESMKYSCTHNHADMAVRTISLHEDAYRLLREAKRPGESFSDVVERLLAPERPRLTGLAGIIPRDAARELRAHVETMRREDVASQRDEEAGGRPGA
jgi:predicted CopG family antitoxin